MASLLGLSGGSGAKGGGMLSLVTPPGKVPGTGLLKVVNLMSSMTGGKSNSALMKSVVGELPGLFGDYPNHTDVAPCAIFIAIFAIFAISHLYIFAKNHTRGQSFWPSFGLAMYCVMRVIGWALRLKWSFNVMNVKIGIASAVFCVVPVIYISIMNMLFGHRIFTWRHPETGDCKWFNSIMMGTYVVVIGIVTMGIVGQSIPYIYFLDQHHLDMCRKVTQAAAILQVLYSFSGLILIAFAYTFKPGTIDHRFGHFNKGEKEELPATISPTWIESVGIFYFPRKGSQIIVYKNQPEANAIRVIANQRPPAGGLSRHQSGDHTHGPRMRTAILLIAVVSALLTISSSFRVASTFNVKARAGVNGQPLSSWLYHNWLMYLFFGPIEIIANVLYLVMRADLRFYIPDMPRKQSGDSGTYPTGSGTMEVGEVQHHGNNFSAYKPESEHLDRTTSSLSSNSSPLKSITTNQPLTSGDPVVIPLQNKQF